MLHLTKAGVEGWRVAIPPLDEQRRIAAILDQVDDLRKKRQRALDGLDGLVNALLIEMFGDSDTNSKGFDVLPLNKLCTRITDGTHQAPQWAESGVPFIFVSNIRDRVISLETDNFVSLDTYKNLTRYCPIEYGDVLYTAVGSYGNAAMVRDHRPFLFQRHIAHIKPDGSRLDPGFLEILLESRALRRQADRVAKGVAQKTVTLADLKAFSVICPPLKLQSVFTARIAEINKLKSIYRAHLSKLEGLFASLQGCYFRGEMSAARVVPELELAG